MSGFDIFLLAMAIAAVPVFIALFFIDAGYGKFYNRKWGPCVNNTLGWILMESPVFFAMLGLWWFSGRRDDIVRLTFFLMFEIHYFQRSFIFPALIRGKGKMPLSIILMAVTFNLLNAVMQGGWIFYVSDPEYYDTGWLTSPQFIIGAIIFFGGMFINIQSDSIIRGLRKPGDTKHYLPDKGLYRYVSSANSFGEFVEWCGFALMTWSWAGVIFAVWTFANLAPRAARIHDRYAVEFAGEFDGKKIRRMIPFIW